MSHIPPSSSSSSSSASSDLTSPNPPTVSSRRQYAPSVPTLSTSQFSPARAPSEASLRFTHSNHLPANFTTTLARLILAPVPLTPSPSQYLSSFPPAANIFHSLLALLAKNSLPHNLHNILTTVSVNPHLHHLPSLSPKDAVAVDFVRAVADSPSRIPIELRNALHKMYHPDRVHQIALLASFAAYYSTVASLLGLTQSVQSHTSYEHDIAAFTEPSEMSAPSSTTHSRASSTKPNLPKRLSSAKNTFMGRVAHPFRLKLARHATHLLERSTWLSDIPTIRPSQDHFIRAAMGFIPEYLTNIKNPNQRAVFIYLIDELLLRDSACGISTAVKNLCCYILARSAENSVLTAHTIFLANRFGADDRQLSACTNLDLLTALHHATTTRDFPSTAASSSCTSSEDDITVEPLRPSLSRRRRRADRFRYSEFAVGVVVDESEVEEDANDFECKGVLSDEYGDQIGWNDDYEGPNVVSLDGREIREKMENDAVKDHDTISDNNNEADSQCEDVENVPLQSSYVLPEDPKVPDVDGLNSMSAEDFARFRHNEFNDEGISEMPSHGQLSRGPIEGFESEDEEIDPELFTAKEVSFLLLAHQVAQASRRNSKTCKKYAGATPGPLVMPDLATIIHGQFDPDSIMEMISVIGAFSFLLRWTVCFPYRPGALEAPVRRFVQTPIALDLCVDTVGQRTNSKQSFSLRLQTGRSFKLPRHAAAYEPV